MRRAAGVLFVLALILTSCSREESETLREETAREETAVRRPAAERRGDRAGEPRSEEDGDEPRRAPEAADSAPGPATRGVHRRIPKDVVIGELEDRLDGPAPVLAAVEELFSELSEGGVPSALLAPGVRTDLEQRLEYMIARVDIAGEVRIGALVRVSDSTYRAPVVAFGARGGRTSGEIYVAETDGAWYISDILVDFTRIDEAGDRPIFEPGSSGPTLLSF
ncbi:MAG: hypothetical protein ACLFPO_02525 [Spirochaetaceae bacterium]